MCWNVFLAFQKSRCEILQSVNRAVHNNDMERISKFAHSLKPSSGDIGAMHLSKLCGELESSAKEKRITDPICNVRKSRLSMRQLSQNSIKYSEIDLVFFCWRVPEAVPCGGIISKKIDFFCAKS